MPDKVKLKPLLSTHIKVVPDVLSDANVQRILQVLKESDLWTPAKISGGKLDTLTRNCDNFSISENKEAKPELKEVDALVLKAVIKGVQTYIKDYGDYIQITGDTGYEALRYSEGGFYGDHVDMNSRYPRAVSCSLALNDDYEGGAWGFWGEEITFSVPAGSAVLFPANFLYPHQILPVTKGTRYSIVTWLS